jgi:hypothetical protein
MPKRWPRLCSSCYAASNYKKEDLDCRLNLLHGYLFASIFSLVPGLPFLLGKRFLLGSLLTISSIPLLFYRPGAIVAVLMISLISSLFWMVRLRLHEKNLSELAIYEPEWH